jgi:hypothetical protein
MMAHVRKGEAKLKVMPVEEVLACIQCGIVPPKEYEFVRRGVPVANKEGQ